MMKSVKPNIEELINGSLVDNTNGLITPSALREVLHKMAVVMQNDHASLRGGGFKNANGSITNYTTASQSPFIDGYAAPAEGVVGVTKDYPQVVVDGSVYFEVTGSDSFMLCCALDGVVDRDRVATLSAGNNNIQFRTVLSNVKANQEMQLYILPVTEPTTSTISVIKIDMDVYPVRIGINT